METSQIKSKTRAALNTQIFVLSNFNYQDDSLDLKIEIEKTNYYEWVMESVDVTTTPKGVAPRYFVEKEELELSADDFDEDGNYIGSNYIPFCLQDQYLNPLLSEFSKDKYGDCYAEYYVISNWGFTGNKYTSGKHDTLNTFLNEIDAEDALFERVEKRDFENDCNRRVEYYMSEEDAKDELLRLYSEIWMVSKKTVQSIISKRDKLEQRRYDLKIVFEEKRKQDAKQRLEHIKKEGGIKSILVDFFKKENHPAPQEIYDFKKQTGLSWNKLRGLYN